MQQSHTPVSDRQFALELRRHLCLPGMEPPVSDRQFALELRDVLRAYLRAVDAWEAGYRKYYRMPGRNGIVSGDLREEWQSYLETRRSLQAMAPRARGLCFKYGLRDPWMPLLKANLGENAPQQRDSSAIGRGERNAVNECTVELLAAAEEWELPATAESPLARGPASWLRRIVDYLY